MSEMDPVRIQELKDQLAAMADGYGFAIMGVFGVEDTSSFAYSIGMSRQQLPDIVVIGLPNEVNHSLISTVCTYLIAKKREEGEFVLPEEGIVLTDVANVPVWLKPVTITEENAVRFSLSRTLHVEKFNCLLSDWKGAQLIWPDTKGNFPWEADFEEHFKTAQPLI